MALGETLSTPAPWVGVGHCHEPVSGLAESLDLAGEVIERQIALIGLDDQHGMALTGARLYIGDAQGAGWQTGRDQLVPLGDHIALAVARTRVDAPHLKERAIEAWPDGPVDAGIDGRDGVQGLLVERDLGSPSRHAFAWIERAEHAEAGWPGGADLLLNRCLAGCVCTGSTDWPNQQHCPNDERSENPVHLSIPGTDVMEQA
jgi:hypothetical protein